MPLCRIGTADIEELTVTLTYVAGRHLQHPHPDGLVEGARTLVQQDPQRAASNAGRTVLGAVEPLARPASPRGEGVDSVTDALLTTPQ